MNKIFFNFILIITVTTNMLVFPVRAAETLDPDVRAAVKDMHNEESSNDPGEEIVIDNDAGAALENKTINEGVSYEEMEKEAGIEDFRTEDDETGNAGSEVTGTGDAIEEELSAEGVTEHAEQAAGGERKEIEEEQLEDDPSAGVTEMISENPEDLPDSQTLNDAPGADKKLKKDETTVPAVVYERPVINSISTDGSFITLEWDNAEGALFRIYRWNIIPYLIGISSTGSFVDTNVAYGWSYTYFIATDSSAYRYPYSQTVSKRVRRPIEDIDEEHKIGEDLAWDLPKGETGRNSLIISGSGSMPDFSSPSETPWRDSADEIKHISIDDGVTYVGDYSFSDMEDLQEVSLPSSVRKYGRDVFRGSRNLEFFNHDSAVDGDQLHIAVQYLMGVYSGITFEPEVHVRKGEGEEDFDDMPALIRGRDYTVTYNNTTDAGDGTIEIEFIEEYVDAGSVVIPFIVASDLRKDEKIKDVTEIELFPSSSVYTGSAQHPEMIVRSGRWVLKEGVDYILTYTDMVDVGTYNVTAKGIGAYSGEAQAVYTILKQKQSGGPKPTINPPAPAKTQNPDAVDFSSREAVKKLAEFNEEKVKIDEGEAEGMEEPKIEKETEAVEEPEIEEQTETLTKPVINLENFLLDFSSYLEDNLLKRGGFSLDSSLGEKGSEQVIFFVGAVGIVASICISVYLWFFHWFLHRM